MSENESRELIIELSKVSYAYPGSASKVIDALDLSFYRGDRVGIMAPNGSGKTTLFYLIMGLIKPDSGSISLFGNRVSVEKDFEVIRHRIGFLFQDADDQLFSPTVLEDVAFGPLNMGKTAARAREIAEQTLSNLGLEALTHRVTHQLSGGEKRMVSLATVLAMEPEVLLLDEPSNGLDEATKQRLIHFLEGLDLSYLVISHDHDFLYELSKTNFTMKEGKLSAMGRMHKHYHSHPHTYHTH